MGKVISGDGLASGPIVISLSPTGRVSGNLKIGSKPRMALTGFSGRMTGNTTFEAAGENQRGEGLDVMFLVVGVQGNVTADGQHMAGTIDAVLNGFDQPEWTFQAAVPGAPDFAVSEPSGELAQQGIAPPPAENGLWSKMSTGVKAALGLTVATVGGVLLWRHYQ
jgi:hypothetical protein